MGPGEAVCAEELGGGCPLEVRFQPWSGRLGQEKEAWCLPGFVLWANLLHARSLGEFRGKVRTTGRGMTGGGRLRWELSKPCMGFLPMSGFHGCLRLPLHRGGTGLELEA